jgi:two-component system, OmpR family, phosphate regulon sensor histidine kinase PhoR
LTSIQGYAETLLDAPGDNGQGREFLEIIRKNAARMSRLTEDLLALARVESGEHKLDPKPIAAGDLLREAQENLSKLAQQYSARLDAETAPNVSVLADREAIQQVFGNLIENALKYAASGGRVVLGAAEQDGSVQFHVRDFGPGIASEHLSRVFERFYRVDKARSRETGGTGLGLAIVKHIILNHGGAVRVESSLGHGSTFYFTLPIARD